MGAWIGLGHYTSSDRTFRQKVAFWRQGFDSHAATEAKLRVGGRRTDTLAPPLQIDGPGAPSWTANAQFFMTGINFPTTGCREITARYKDVALTFGVWIAAAAFSAALCSANAWQGRLSDDPTIRLGFLITVKSSSPAGPVSVQRK